MAAAGTETKSADPRCYICSRNAGSVEVHRAEVCTSCADGLMALLPATALDLCSSTTLGVCLRVAIINLLMKDTTWNVFKAFTTSLLPSTTTVAYLRRALTAVSAAASDLVDETGAPVAGSAACVIVVRPDD